MTTSRRSFHRPLRPWTTLSSSRRSNTYSAGDSPLPIAAGDFDKTPISPSQSSDKPTRKEKSDPTRDILWSNEATKTLIEAWGDRYIELNRSSLKQQNWQQVTDVVNLHHADQFRCTDIQARNRIDTVKKKYKKEKSMVSQSAGKYVSPWPFFDYLDSLIGSSSTAPAIMTRRRTPTLTLPPTYSIPVGRRTKRPAPVPEIFSGNVDLARRKFEVMAEAAAKMAEEEEKMTTEEEDYFVRRHERDGNGELKQIAEAIEKFGERYERVEREKVNQMIELEKHKMQLAIELNEQMMNYISELKVKLDKNEQTEEANSEKESKL